MMKIDEILRMRRVCMEWPVGLLLPSSGGMPPEEPDPEHQVERGKVDKRGDKEKITKYVPPT